MFLGSPVVIPSSAGVGEREWGISALKATCSTRAQFYLGMDEVEDEELGVKVLETDGWKGP